MASGLFILRKQVLFDINTRTHTHMHTFTHMENNNKDPAGIFLVILIFSMMVDLIWIVLYAEQIIEGDTWGNLNTKKVALGMSITVFIIKPAAIYFSHLFFQERGGSLGGGGSGGSGGGGSSYIHQENESYDQAGGTGTYQNSNL